MKIKFSLSSSGVKHNLVDMIKVGNYSKDQVVDIVLYQSKLTHWWEYKYNCDQPTQIMRVY